jgi:hypothetical protein
LDFFDSQTKKGFVFELAVSSPTIPQGGDGKMVKTHIDAILQHDDVDDQHDDTFLFEAKKLVFSLK